MITLSALQSLALMVLCVTVVYVVSCCVDMHIDDEKGKARKITSKYKMDICPFCRGTSSLYRRRVKGRLFSLVQCDNCEAVGACVEHFSSTKPSSYYDYVTVMKWNIRFYKEELESVVEYSG